MFYLLQNTPLAVSFTTMSANKRILFITANRIGDAILSTGVLAHLVEVYPDARFTIACGPVATDIFRAVPQLDRIISMRKQKHHGHWLALWRACINTEWDLIVDLRNSIVSRLLHAKARAYRPAHNTGHHRVEDNAQALRLSPSPDPKIWLDDESLAMAAKIVPSGEKLFALGPTANWPAKQWPCFNFIHLAKRLTASDGVFAKSKILVVAAPNEREQIVPLFNALPSEQIVDCVGHDLLTVAACLQKCSFFIGNDSGLMHLSAAVGTPTLGLFGPGYEKVYGPWGAKASYVRTIESTAQLLEKEEYPGADYPNF